MKLPILPPTSNITVRADDLVNASIATNTRRAYAGAMLRFSRWLGDRKATDSTVAEYLSHLFDDGQSPATAAQVVAALNFLEKLDGQKIVGPKTRRTLAGFRRQALGRGRDQAKGLQWEQADAVAEKAAQNGLAGLRDATIIAVASDALLRISEVAAMQYEDVNLEPDGSATLLIRSSKTDQEGKGTVLFLGQPTVERLVSWLRAASIIKSGPMFRRIVRDGHIQETGLCARSIARILASRAEEAGIKGRVTGHSLRVGSAQSLAGAGASVVEMQIAGRWQSPSMPGRYARKQLATRGAVARLRYKTGGGT